MKEVIYIQAGTISNYTGTHFWNTQESYLQSTEDPEIDPTISFCETVSGKETSTLCPRLLTFDRKSNFGTLSDSNTSEAEDSVNSLWEGELTEYRQEIIPKVPYQIRLDEESHHEATKMQDSNTGPALHQDQDIGKIRYWSDFSRGYYLPKSLHKLSDPPNWETTSSNWNDGQELFSRYNEESELIDGSLRLLVEDCDNMQGIQILADGDPWGSFMSSFFAAFRDEYPKIPSFTFPVLSGVLSSNYNRSESQRTRQLVNEALYLRSLNEYSSMNILIEDPKFWSSSVWNSDLNYPTRELYQQSAILSTHIETSTLPFRMTRNQRDIPSVCAQLNWRGTTVFGELHGIFPFSSSLDFQTRLYNFSSDLSTKPSSVYSRLDVTRGFSPQQVIAYENWCAQISSSNISYVSQIQGPVYPIPSSFPPLTPSFHEEERAKRESPGVEVYTSSSVSTNIAEAFKTYASTLEGYLKSRSSALLSTDIPLDDLKDLLNDLWTIYYNTSEDIND